MKATRPLLSSLLRPLPLLLTCTPGLADNCESLSAQIDARIRAAGVASFSLVTVGINDAAAGKVVGTCGQGTKKIVYSARAGSAPTGAASAPRRAARPSPTAEIITECRDGSMSLGGECRN